jgi:hypothetical protein
MASWRLMHRATGMVLSGYIVLSASPTEIDQANSKLKTSGSDFRYVPNQHEPPGLQQKVVQPA